MATREQLIEDFADHKLATGEKFVRLINSTKAVQEPVADPAASGTSLSFIDSIEQDKDGKITATKKTLDLANAHELNPFKGWWKTGDTLPTSGFDGAYLYFKDTSEQTGLTTIYRWNGTAYADTGTVVDTSNVQTFETGQAVNETAIDGTHLVNPASNALAKAGDVMQLAAKLEGVTAGETKVAVVMSGEGQNVMEGYKILGNTGLLSQQLAYNCFEIPTDSYKKIRFLGIVLRSGLNSDDKNSGYAFGHYVDNSWVTDLATNYEINTENSNLVREYIIDVPTGATHFRCASKFGSVMTQDSFYCYCKSGDTVVDVIKKEIAESKFYGKTYNLVGLGAVSERNEITLKLQQGCVYRVYKPNGMTNTSFYPSFGWYVFGWLRVLNGAMASNNGVYVSDITLMPDYFDIVAEENDYYTIFCRADYGNEFNVTIEQIDPVSNDIVLTMDAKVGGYVVASDGTWDENAVSANCVFKSKRPTMGKKYIKITWPILLYSARALDRGLAWYDVNGNYIGGIKMGDINVSGDNSGDTGGQRESVPVIITIPERAKFFNYTYWFGQSFTSYPQLQKIGDVILTNDGQNDIPLVSGNFGGFVDFLDYDGPTGDTLMLQTYATLIQQWDAIQSAHSEVITAKQLLGYGTAAGEGDAVADTNLPIYEYVVHPIPHNDTGYEEYDTTIPNNVVKVLIVTGVHGAEKPASTAVLELVKHLVGHYSSSKYNDAIVSLAQNCEFHIIPCVNPRGYDVMYNSGITPGSRNNARGVNINRNFGHNWTYQVGGDVAAKGTAPYSELETQIVRDWISANKDAFIYIDAHTTYLGNSPLQGCYNYAFDLFSKCILNAYMKQVSIYAQRQWPTIFTQNQYIGFLGFNNQACTASEARYVNNIPRVATLEVNNNAGGLGRGNEEQVVLALNQIINYIRMCIDNAEKQNVKM